MKFILDTSFLIYASQKKIDVKMELMRFGLPELFTTSGVVNELKKLSKNRGKKGMNARVSVEMLREMGVKEMKSRLENVDDDLIDKALKENMVICTADKSLGMRARKFGIRVAMVRNGVIDVF